MQEITISPMLVSKEIVQKKWIPKFSVFKFFMGFLLYKNKIIKNGNTKHRIQVAMA